MAAQREWFEKDYYAVLGVPRGRDRQGASRAPTRSSRSSTTPTRTRATRTPRSASRRSRPRTTCSATPRSARSTTRSARWSRRASVPAASAASAAVRAGSAVARRSSFDDRRRSAASATSSATCSAAVAAVGAARGAARGGPAARPGPRDRAAPRRSTTRCTASPATVRFRADATCSTCHGIGRGAGHDARDVPAVPRRGLDRGRPGPVLVLAGVPDVRRARPGHPDAVPDVSRAAGSRCAPREVKVRIPAGVADGQRIR